MAEAMLKDQSNDLYAGKLLAAFDGTDLLNVRTSRLQEVSLDSDAAATLFSLNMQTLKHQPFVQVQYPPEQIAQLEAGLQRLSREPDRAVETVFGLRQVVLERV